MRKFTNVHRTAFFQQTLSDVIIGINFENKSTRIVLNLKENMVLGIF